MVMKLLGMDTESGGPGAEFSLLTACFKVFENVPGSGWAPTDKLKFAIKRDVYRVHPGGMFVNKLDLNEINSSGLTLGQASKQLSEFLTKHAKGAYLMPLGHGVQGDIKIITQGYGPELSREESGRLISREHWGGLVSPSYVDSFVLASAKQAKGEFPADMSLKLMDVCQHLGVTGINFHECEGDVDASAAAVFKMW
jgi:hypothetical protein